MMKDKSLLCLMSILSLIWSSCSEPRVDFPEELGLDSRLYLGQRLGVLVADDWFRRDVSWSGYAAQIRENPFFHAVYVNTEISGYTTMRSLEVSGPPREKFHRIDSLRSEIISILISHYGEHFRILEDDRSSISSVFPPVLVWDLDSFSVSFGFPTLEVRENTPWIMPPEDRFAYILTIAYEIPKILSHCKPSHLTREELGIE
jgi:hypothetical protein